MSNPANNGKLALLVGGGPAPGINGVISVATSEARNQGMEIIGFQDGFYWLIRRNLGHYRPLDIADVKDYAPRGGSLLGTSQANPVKSAADMASVVHVLRTLGVSDLITIGGDDTAFSSSQVYKNLGGAIRVAHVPLPWPDLAGRSFVLQDFLSPASYGCDGSDLADRGLYLDVPEWHCHVFDVRPGAIAG